MQDSSEYNYQVRKCPQSMRFLKLFLLQSLLSYLYILTKDLSISRTVAMFRSLNITSSKFNVHGTVHR